MTKSNPSRPIAVYAMQARKAVREMATAQRIGIGLILLTLTTVPGCGSVIDTEEVLQPRLPSTSVVDESTGGPETVGFSATVLPFLRKYCIDCHNPTSLRGGVDLSSYESLVAGGLVRPGDAQGSRLVIMIMDGMMPPVGIPFPSDAEIASVEMWIQDGASNN